MGSLPKFVGVIRRSIASGGYRQSEQTKDETVQGDRDVSIPVPDGVFLRIGPSGVYPYPWPLRSAEVAVLDRFVRRSIGAGWSGGRDQVVWLATEAHPAPARLSFL